MSEYWNLSERERAELTKEQLDRFADLERMEQGVAVVPELALMEVPVLNVPRQTFYTVKLDQYTTLGAFETAAEAEEFARNTKMFKSSYEHSIGYEHRYASRAAFQITPEPLYTESDFRTHKATIEQVSAATAHNKAAREAYDTALKKWEQVATGVYQDHYDCKRSGARHQQVVDTFTQYKELAKGDEAVACSFLGKAFKPEEITRAFAWFGIPNPTEQPASVA